jgi:malonyl-CoA/methylmalonyl-CoA synthetase
MNSIVEAVLAQSVRQPERTVLNFQDQQREQVMTYGQLSREVEAFARALVAWGIQAEDRVALFLENSPAFVVAYLGAHLAGGVVVLVNAQYREVELRHIISDSGARICVTSPSGGELLQSLALPTSPTLVLVGGRVADSGDRVDYLSFADLVRKGAALPDPPPLRMPIPEASAVIGYTSGTTGPAKGALLTHRNLVANIKAVTTAWRWDASDRLLLVLPLFHTHGLMVGLHGTLFTGASAVLHRTFVASDVLDLLRLDESITLFFGVPTMYGRLLAEADREGNPSPILPPHRPRLLVSGSAPLSAQLFADFERRFGRRILERYGMTETIMNLTNPYEGERRPGTVGSPFPGQEARIVDRLSRQPLPFGEIGEIEVRGPNVFSRYWNRPDATAEAFNSDGWFRTGDLGWCSEDGYFTITGRAHELIISGGYNVYPREVEDVLATHPGVAEVAVLGLSDPDLGEQVVAVIVPRPGSAPTAGDITTFCRERLAAYKKPRRIVFVETLPRNALGKVQKHLLSERVLGSR